MKGWLILIVNEKKMISLEQQKLISQEILDYIAEFCNKHNIRYYLAYGTLLGAVRHQGFIPWDDDIDIIMFREDYRKFLSLFRSNRYHCLSFENDTYYQSFSKIVDSKTAMVTDNMIPLEDLGVAVDIFPFDYLSDDRAGAERIKKELTLLFKLMRYSLYPCLRKLAQGGLPVSKCLFYCVAKPFGWKFWSKLLRNKIRKLTSSTKKAYCGHLLPFNSGAEFVYESRLFDEVSNYTFNGKEYVSVADISGFRMLQMPIIGSKYIFLD